MLRWECQAWGGRFWRKVRGLPRVSILMYVIAGFADVDPIVIVASGVDPREGEGAVGERCHIGYGVP